MQEKICPSCGSKFECGANTQHCWCDDVKISKDQAERLNACCGNTCVCPDCITDPRISRRLEIKK